MTDSQKKKKAIKSKQYLTCVQPCSSLLVFIFRVFNVLIYFYALSAEFGYFSRRNELTFEGRSPPGTLWSEWSSALGS